MNEFIQLLHTFGDGGLNYIWFPLLIWTIIALPLSLILHRFETIPPVYQYHSRVALLLALPLGISGSYLTELIGRFLNSSAGSTAKLIVIQNPITVSASQSEPGMQQLLSAPTFWIGLISLLLTAGVVYHLIKLAIYAIQLTQLSQELSFIPLKPFNKSQGLSKANDLQDLNPLIAFSEETNVPFTYGWLRTKIVIPAELNQQPEKMAMVIRHELMHIKHKDFLLNGVLMIIKALFWFHPLVHRLYGSSQEYREITCDGQVLADDQFSKKRYAALLFELAEREYNHGRLAMSMAVNPSSLKKRIHIMTTQPISTSTFRSSFLLTFVAASLVILSISCSDINSDNGITNSEFQEAQGQMALQKEGDKPLYVINGEQIKETTSQENPLSLIKSKYIKSIDILKGQKAIDEYGDAGRNGVIEMQLADGIDKETVFNDLKNNPGSAMNSSNEPQDDFYVAVEQMPELKGGLQGLASKINYPEEAANSGTEGRVTIQFIVNEQGKVENPKVLRSVSESLDKEALRVVKLAEFKPGKQSGKAVRVQYSLPISFRLPDQQTNQNSK